MLHCLCYADQDTKRVNPEHHEVYLPLQNIGGRPVLRIMRAVVP